MVKERNVKNVAVVIVVKPWRAVSGESFVAEHVLSGVLFVNIIVYWNIVARYYVFLGCFFLSA